MPSHLDPATASWSTDSLLASAGENHTTAQQNAAMENGGWLFANQPRLFFDFGGTSFTVTSTTWANIMDAWAWHPAGLDFLSFFVHGLSGGIHTVHYQVQIPNRDSGTWTTLGGTMGWDPGQTGWRGVSTGTLTLANDEFVNYRVQAKREDTGDGGTISRCIAWLFGQNIGMTGSLSAHT